MFLSSPIRAKHSASCFEASCLSLFTLYVQIQSISIKKGRCLNIRLFLYSSDFPAISLTGTHTVGKIHFRDFFGDVPFATIRKHPPTPESGSVAKGSRRGRNNVPAKNGTQTIRLYTYRRAAMGPNRQVPK